MKFVSVRDFRTAPADIWKTLPEEREFIEIIRPRYARFFVF
jgi:hypothetical protein